MAERKTSDDDFNPRHRIAGAVILVALAVIFLPQLLSDRLPEDNAVQSGTGMPAPDARAANAPNLYSLPGLSPSRSVSAPKPAATEMVAPRNSTRTVTVALDALPPEKPAMKPMADPKPAPPPQPEAALAEPRPVEPKIVKPEGKPVRATPAEPRNKVWFVQVGAFTQASNARRLQEKLKGSGYTVIMDPPQADAGTTVRVEVGPYKDQAAARAAVARLQTEHRLQGVVRQHKE